MGPYGYTGTIQTVTVGTTGTFQITGYGARGGKNGQYLGGNGAEEGGTFNLTAGEQLEIVVGGAGANGGYAGGGGGSFVLANIGTNHAFVPLVVAGGGGGAGSGAGGAGGGAAGNGYGGSASYIDGGGNGAGVKSNGANGANGGYGGGGGYNGSAANGSNAYHGGTGYGPNGGFGGGGSGGSYGGGGGGGYSGGGGGYGGGGGGGTSYVASLASAPFNGDAGTENAANGGNGEVIITPNAVCYVSGTLIRTARGDVAVEDLVVGDLAATASGVHRPIRWLGHRILRHSGAPQASPEPGCFTMSGLERVQTIPAPAHPGSGFELRPPRNDGGLTPDAWPIRISAHAFGPNRPARDLYVSPGHSICVTMIEEVLIPASALVNGTTIQQVEVDEVTYWHVELDSHDILLAENLPAESYIEMGNRNFFREADVVSLDALPDATLDARTHADFCRPFHSEGPIVEAARSHLRARRAAIGWTLTHDPMADLHLVADGKRIEPAIRDLTARFSVPAGAKNVWLVSNTSRPCDVADSVDGRELGVYLTGLTIDDGFDAGRPIALADPLLCVGFHEVEEGVRRWTAGRARLPAALWEACPEGFFLRLDCVQPALPRWVAPAEAMTIRTAA